MHHRSPSCLTFAAFLSKLVPMPFPGQEKMDKLITVRHVYFSFANCCSGRAIHASVTAGAGSVGSPRPSSPQEVPPQQGMACLQNEQNAPVTTESANGHARSEPASHRALAVEETLEVIQSSSLLSAASAGKPPMRGSLWLQETICSWAGPLLQRRNSSSSSRNPLPCHFNAVVRVLPSSQKTASPFLLLLALQDYLPFVFSSST